MSYGLQLKKATKKLKCVHCRHSIRKGDKYYYKPPVKGNPRLSAMRYCCNCEKLFQKIEDDHEYFKKQIQPFIDIQSFPLVDKVEVIFKPTGFHIYDFSTEEYEELLEDFGGDIERVKHLAYDFYCECQEDMDPKAMFSMTLVDVKSKARVRKNFCDLLHENKVK